MKKCLVIEKRGPWTNEETDTKINTINNGETLETEKSIEIPQFLLHEQYLRKKRQQYEININARNKRHKKIKWKKRLATVMECIKLLALMILGLLSFWAWTVIIIILFG